MLPMPAPQVQVHLVIVHGSSWWLPAMAARMEVR